MSIIALLTGFLASCFRRLRTQRQRNKHTAHVAHSGTAAPRRPRRGPDSRLEVRASKFEVREPRLETRDSRLDSRDQSMTACFAPFCTRDSGISRYGVSHGADYARKRNQLPITTQQSHCFDIIFEKNLSESCNWQSAASASA